MQLRLGLLQLAGQAGAFVIASLLVRCRLLELRTEPGKLVLALLGGRPGRFECLLDLCSRLDSLHELDAKLVDPSVLLGQRRLGGGSGCTRVPELGEEGFELVGGGLLLPRAEKPGGEAACLVAAAGKVVMQLLDAPVALRERGLDVGARGDDALELGREVVEAALLRVDGRLGGAERSSRLLELVVALGQLVVA